MSHSACADRSAESTRTPLHRNWFGITISTAKTDFRRLEEIYAVFGRKSLPIGENFNCSVICSTIRKDILCVTQKKEKKAIPIPILGLPELISKSGRSQNRYGVHSNLGTEALSIGSQKSDIPAYLVTYVFVCHSTVYAGPSVGKKIKTYRHTPCPTTV
jgi:hypothetical protein